MTALRSSTFALVLLLVGVPQFTTVSAQLPCQSHETYRNGAFGTIDCQGHFTPTDRVDFKAPPASQAADLPSSAQSPQQAAEDANAEKYAAWRYNYVESVFTWQYYSSFVLFGVVLALVAAGLYFAYRQFSLSIDIAGKTFNSEEVTIGSHGVVVKTSFLGVAILAFSLAFFFLYLRFVYPITYAEAKQTASATEASARDHP
jgi:hypothetical protein